MADDLGVWVHGVARTLDTKEFTGTTGVDGHPVRTLESAGLVAVVSSVNLDVFGAEPLRRNLEDLAWLEATARAHHQVVDAVCRVGPVVPTRLATVFRDDARVCAVLARRRDELAVALDRVAGRTEWGVKAYAVPGTTAAVVASDAGGGPGGAGAAYLRRRRAQLSAREEGQQAALNSVQEVHAALGGLAERAQRHRPQEPRLSAETGAMLLNGAYLVDVRRGAEFSAAVTDLADRHRAIRLQLTGPWPPYSFAAVEVGDDSEPSSAARGVLAAEPSAAGGAFAAEPSAGGDRKGGR